MSEQLSKVITGLSMKIINTYHIHSDVAHTCDSK